MIGTDGIETLNSTDMIKCDISVFSDFSVGGGKPVPPEPTPPVSPLFPTWLLVLIIVLGMALIIISGVLIYCYCIKKGNETQMSEINHEPLVRNNDDNVD